MWYDRDFYWYSSNLFRKKIFPRIFRSVFDANGYEFFVSVSYQICEKKSCSILVSRKYSRLLRFLLRPQVDTL